MTNLNGYILIVLYFSTVCFLVIYFSDKTDSLKAGGFIVLAITILLWPITSVVATVAKWTGLLHD